MNRLPLMLSARLFTALLSVLNGLESPHKGNANFDMVKSLSESSVGKDEFSYRRSFIQMINAAKSITALN